MRALDVAAVVVGVALMGGWSLAWRRVRRTRLMKKWRRDTALLADGGLRSLRGRRPWRGR